MRLLRPGETCGQVVHADRAGVLVDAEVYYRALHRSLLLAERQIVMAGWQFDSRTRLLRGAEAEDAEAPVELASLLDHLCQQRPELQIYVLSWDPNVVYLLERELFQRVRFQWGRSNRIRFVFDDVHPLGASHHQKMVVVDGRLAFAGGMDICGNRWDVRAHPPTLDERQSERGKPFGPYHDVQAFVTGPAAEALHGLFRERWWRATGEQIALPSGDGPVEPPFEPTIELPAGPVGISRTRGAMAVPARAPVQEIKRLVTEAITRAERMIYVENQYLTSEEVQTAFLHRIRDEDRPTLDIVLVLPRRAQAWKEAIALMARQELLVQDMREEALARGHRVGIYHPTASGGGTDTYVHSKLLIVDDRILSLGSSNLTNRSLGLDTELNLTWEAEGDDGLSESICRLRVELLLEHCGCLGRVDVGERLREPTGLVERLEELASARRRLLRFEPQPRWLLELAPQDVGDPSTAELDETVLPTARRVRPLTRAIRGVRRVLRR